MAKEISRRFATDRSHWHQISQNHPEAPENAERESKKIEGAGIGVLPSFGSRGLGTVPKSSRLLGRHSAPHQSGRGDYYTKRTGHPTSKPLPGERAIQEHRHADRAIAEERH